MDTSLSCLINSISRFIHLVLCQATVSAHLQPSYRKATELLKQLKLVLDEVAEQKNILQHGNQDVLYKQCEELDMAVNEAREFMESWSPKMSKICSILQCEPLLMRIQKLSLEICQIFCTLLPSSSSSLARIKELQCLKQDGVVNHIEDALRDQQDGIVPHTDTIMQIIELLNLRPNQELFRESLAVEKERINAQSTGAPEHLYEIINQIVGLVAHIRECLVRTGSCEIKSGVPIPPYFLCPLSLELMLDPVIVASGQTYDRPSIQKWLDHGLDICPKTRQLLSHKNLIPNYTVKAMAESWCEQNGVKIPNSAKSQSQDLVFQRSTVGSPQSKSSTPRSSSDLGNRSDNGLSDLSLKSSRDSEDYDSQLLDLVCTLSRSESASSSMSNVDYVQQTSFDMSRRSSQPEIVAPSQVRSFPNPDATRNQLSGSSRENMLVSQNGSASGFDDLTTKDRVMKLVDDLQSQSDETQGAAAAELRLLAKHNKENRVIIGQARAIPPLVSLLYSKVKETQEHAVTTLLNLSISEENKAMIAEAGAIEPLIHVLRSGTEGAKENSAAALFSLSNLEDYRAKIGRSGAVKALVSLLATGTLRGKKDAATALFNLSIFHENKSRIVQSGAVKYLVEMLDPDSGMVDKSVALLANLSTIGEGRMAIAKAGGIPSLVEVVESGSQRGKENAASVILQLCLNSPKFCTLVLQEGVVPPLVALSQSGTPRAKEKAQQLLSHFRNQREIGMVKGKA